MKIVESRYNWFTLGDIYSVKEEKDKLIVEIDRAKGSVGYLIGAIIVFFPFVSVTICFIIYSYNPLTVKFAIFPFEFFLLIFLFLVGFYFSLLYLNNIYFHRASKFIFDKTLQKITHQSIIPQNRKDEIFELGKVQSVVYHRDKIDLAHDIVKLRISFENGDSLRLIKARIPHFMRGCHKLGELIAEFLGKSFTSVTSWRLEFVQGNAYIFFVIYVFIEVAYRFPEGALIALVIIISAILFAIFFNISHLTGKTTSKSIKEASQIKKQRDMLMDSKTLK